MGYGSNSFPVFLSVKADGQVEATIRRFEDFAVGAMQKVTRAATAAGAGASDAFRFDKALTELNNFASRMDGVKQAVSKGISDPFGISSALSGLKSNPLLGFVADQVQAEQKLGAARLKTVGDVNTAETALDQQRRAALQERLAGEQRVFNEISKAVEKARELAAAAKVEVGGRNTVRSLDAALSAGPRGVASPEDIARAQGSARASAEFFEEVARAAKAAEDEAKLRAQGIARAFDQIVVAARAQQAEMQRLVAMPTGGSRLTVSGPAYDVGAAREAANNARLTAQTYQSLALGAERAVQATTRATATDLAYAAAMRETANAANLEADRLQELAATQERVMATMRNGASSIPDMWDRIGVSVTASASNIRRGFEQIAEAARAAKAEQERLVGGREFVQAPGFNPGAAQLDATQARAYAAELDKVARAAENVAQQAGKATATDRAFAAEMRQAAAAAATEADRLEELAATQQRVAAGAKGLTGTTEALATSQRGSRQATIQASQQFQDFFIQVQGGQNAMVAFSQQASQLAFVMQDAGGKAGRLATTMAGPFGTAFFLGLAVLTPFVAKLFETDKAGKDASKSLGDMVKELQKTEREARAAAEAEDVFAKTIEGASKFVREMTKDLENQNATLRDNIELKKGQIQANLNVADTEVDSLSQQLRFAKAELFARQKRADELTSGGAVGENPAAQIAAAGAFLQQQQDQVNALIASLNAAVKTREALRRGLASVDIPVILEAAKAANDPIAQINLTYDQMVSNAEKAARANLALKDSLFETVKGIEAQRKAAIAAEEARQKKDRPNRAEANEAARRATYEQFALPVDGSIGSRFGPRKPPPLPGGGFGSAYHKGVDIRAPDGSPVKAPAVATVETVGFDPGLGKFVILNHGGTKTRYGHLEAASVANLQAGDRLEKGEQFARTGRTGRTQGGHLHYEVFEGGKQVDPLKGRFRTDQFAVATQASNASERAARAAQKAAEQAVNEQNRLADVGSRAADRVAGISEQFDKQPRLIDQAKNAWRDLEQVTINVTRAQGDYDALIAKLKNDKPEGYEGQVAALESAKGALAGILADATKAGAVVQEGLVRPLTDFVTLSAEQAEIDALILAGREDQAEVMQQILALEQRMGPLNEKQKLAVEQIVAAERMRRRALEENEKLLSKAVGSANAVQEAITGIVANPFDLKNLKGQLQSVFADFQQNWAESISRNLLGGDLGSQFEDMLRMKSDPLGQAGSDLTLSALDLSKSAVALVQAASAITTNAANAAADVPTVGQVAATPSAYGVGAGGPSPIAAIGGLVGGRIGSIMQTLASLPKEVTKPNLVERDTLDVGTTAVDIQKRTLELQQRSALLANPVQYYNLLGKTVGGKLDQALGTGIFGKIGGKLGTALQGAQLGQMSGSLLKALGVKTSSTGSAIGGALGALTPLGPLGGIIGGAIGGILGGLFKKTKRASATIGANDFGSLDITETSGNNKSRIKASTRAADSVIDSVEQLAEQLGATVDASKGAVSIGIRKGDYRVDPTGQGRTKGPDVMWDFGDDAQAAMEAAIQDLIRDGVLDGIREGTQKLLGDARNLSRGITKALKFEGVFTRLKEFQDPTGAAIDRLDREFNELRRIFAEAGASAAEYAELEKLYAFERAEAVKNAAKDMTSTLKALLNDLTFKGDFGLSLRTRRTNAMANFAPYQQQIQSGQAVDQEGFSEAARALLDVERQLYGSTSQYFETLNMITALTRAAISASGGGTVTVPGITPTATPTATQAPIPANTTSATPGMSTVAPGSGYVSSTQAAANDNYAMGAMIVQAIKEQTAALSAFLNQNAITSAIQTAFLNMVQTRDERGDVVFALKPLADAVLVGNGQVLGKLTELTSYARDDAENSGNMLRLAETSASKDGAAWWDKAGAGSAYGTPRPSQGYNPLPNNSEESDFPFQRITTSVSRF